MEESLLVVRSLDVEIPSTSWIGCSSSRFIPISSIGDFWIQEGFYGFKVRFYLVAVKGGRRACGGGVCNGFFPLAN